MACYWRITAACLPSRCRSQPRRVHQGGLHLGKRLISALFWRCFRREWWRLLFFYLSSMGHMGRDVPHIFPNWSDLYNYPRMSWDSGCISREWHGTGNGCLLCQTDFRSHHCCNWGFVTVLTSCHLMQASTLTWYRERELERMHLPTKLTFESWFAGSTNGNMSYYYVI